MKFAIFGIILILQIFIFCINSTTVQESKVGFPGRRYKSGKVLPENQVPTELRCGGLINATLDTLLGIEYHPFDMIGANERCVWLVRAPLATEYVVEIVYLGFSQSNDDHRLVISGIGFGNSSENMDHINVNFEANYNSYGNVLMVTFSTGPSPPAVRGFIMAITPRLGLGTPSSADSQLVFATTNIGALRHPQSGNYGNNDLSAFVFTPGNNSVATGGRTDVIYILNGMETGCGDNVGVYKFDINSALTHKWEFVGELCANTTVELITSTDILLLVFRSDDATGGTGFQLSFTKCADALPDPSTTINYE